MGLPVASSSLWSKFPNPCENQTMWFPSIYQAVRERPEHLTYTEWPQNDGLLERELIVSSDCGAGTKLLTPEQQQETTYCDGSLEVHPKLIRSALSHYQETCLKECAKNKCLFNLYFHFRLR